MIRKKAANSPLVPSFTEERMLVAQGYRYIAGIDEVGRGALAGPVVAAAVILPSRPNYSWLGLVRDSKLLSPARREFLFHHIREKAIAVGVGLADHKFIDARGIVRATERAMRLAIDRLSPAPEALLIDYMHLPGVRLWQKGIIHGDALCFSIACASIVAKVTRDRLMVELDGDYPGYALAQHKGYCTSDHFDRLCRLGPSPIHRQSFWPVRGMIEA